MSVRALLQWQGRAAAAIWLAGLASAPMAGARGAPKQELQSLGSPTALDPSAFLVLQENDHESNSQLQRLLQERQNLDSELADKEAF